MFGNHSTLSRVLIYGALAVFIADHAIVMKYILRMLCARVVHGDLSEFNVLLDDHGPVIIDLPQAADAAGNNNARAMLERDVNNMTCAYQKPRPY